MTHTRARNADNGIEGRGAHHGEASTIRCITFQAGLAVAMCGAPVSFHRCGALPPADVIGKIVMIAAHGSVVGCARLTGVVSLTGAPEPSHEHRAADTIRQSLGAKAELFGPRLWVFEDGLLFDEAIEVGDGASDTIWGIPESLHGALQRAHRAAAAREARASS